MNILLSNDDGFNAPGINHLRKHLRQSSNVLTIAPDRDRSGSSNALTLETPLRLTPRGEQFYSVNGTPTDCVHLGLTGLYDEYEKKEPDMVISGINAGANLGDDVIYSGTVAAAMEGRNLGLPALAVSLASHHPRFYESAVKAVELILPRLTDFMSTEASTILNVNVPDVPWEEIQGFKSTRLGRRHKAEPVIRTTDPRGEEIFWVGPVGEEQDAGEGTDFYAIQQHYISVTPIHIDLTQHATLKLTQDWLNKL